MLTKTKCAMPATASAPTQNTAARSTAHTNATDSAAAMQDVANEGWHGRPALVDTVYATQNDSSADAHAAVQRTHRAPKHRTVRETRSSAEIAIKLLASTRRCVSSRKFTSSASTALVREHASRVARVVFSGPITLVCDNVFFSSKPHS